MGGLITHQRELVGGEATGSWSFKKEGINPDGGMEKMCSVCVCAGRGGHAYCEDGQVGSQPFPAGADNVHSWCSKVFLVGKNVVVKIRGPVSRSQLTVSGPVFPCLCNDGVSPPPYSHHE